jgi:hypothetical protein
MNEVALFNRAGRYLFLKKFSEAAADFEEFLKITKDKAAEAQARAALAQVRAALAG